MTDRTAITEQQLLHLVDRARRGVILPAELDDLQGGIVALSARLKQAEKAAATPRELELRQRRAWSAAGACPMCGYDDTDGRLCGDCTTAVRRLPARDRRQWRRYEPVHSGQPVVGHGYTPAGLLGLTTEETK
ncbi:hypothetical protein ACFXKC_28530 [Streptomyces sp. NPDC059340]|uniref:hypothetical protein n=1 Tax=Streptomyces sp. NPDC059340 TaxID=3346806 RepID=UPI0036CD254D